MSAPGREWRQEVIAELRPEINALATALERFAGGPGGAELHDKFVRALIFTMAGFIASATAIAGTVLVALGSPGSRTLFRRIGGELLIDVVAVMVAAVAVVLLLQCLRFALNKWPKKRWYYAGGGLAAAVVAAFLALTAAKTAVCAGAAYNAPARSPWTTATVPDLGRELPGYLRSLDCSSHAARWFGTDDGS